MKSVTKIAAMALMLGVASPAFATMNTPTDANATDTNPMINQKDTIKGDTAPHANAPASVEAKSPMGGAMSNMTPEQRMQMRAAHEERMKSMTPEQKAQMQKMHEARMEKMKNMTPEQREAAHKKWEAKRAEYEKMTPEQREAAKAKWEANKSGHKDLNKEDRQTNINGGVGSAVEPAPAVQ